MRRVFQFTALVVLALWLPTTVHCNLEALLSWQAETCCGDHAEKPSAPVDHCGVEDGSYRMTTASVVVAAPDLLLCWCGQVVWAAPAVEATAPAPDFSESPPGLTRTWQFVERAALPARAPTRVS